MKFFSMIAIFMVVIMMSCNGQPRSNYELYSEAIPGVVQYQYFLEKDLGQAPHLVQGCDYLSPSVVNYTVAVSTAPNVVIDLPNDDSRYIIGVVAFDIQGFYSGMGVATGQVGKVPITPAGIGMRKLP